MHRELGLFSISGLEKGRIEEVRSDLKDLSRFGELEALISHSLAPPTLVQTRTPSGTKLKEPRVLTRAFHDESLLQKLIQYRERIPLSSRVIRTESK